MHDRTWTGTLGSCHELRNACADHCSNIAVYMMQLNDTGLEEHSFTEQMDEKESAEFTKLENEFEQKYEID